MINAPEISKAFGVPCIVSSDMMRKTETWERLFQNRARWLSDRVKTMRIPVSIAREFKRLALTELELTSDRDDLSECLQSAIPLLRRKLDAGLAYGGMLMKPYRNGSKIYADLVPQNQYLPVNYTDDVCTSVICPDEIVVGNTYYVRLEYHVYDSFSMTHTITNRYFSSSVPGFLGRECNVPDIPEWQNIPEKEIFSNVHAPLFSVFRTPNANNVDPSSPLGVSVFADAVDFIHDADLQWERILWELESAERAIDASEDLFRFDLYTQKPILPKGKERMFMIHESGNDGKPFFNTFSPEIRDTSQFNSLNQMLRRIENAVGLSYGTLSEVSEVEKTAEEVRSSKQRSFSCVKDIQQNLKTALQQLGYGMQYYIDNTGGNGHQNKAEITCTFGDGVLEDTEKEFQRRLLLAQGGYYRPELLLSWYFECDEEEAKKMMPDNSMQSNASKLFEGDA